jgi:hypothetical protein
MRAIAIAFSLVMVGCAASKTGLARGDDGAAMAEKAKAAILALARSDRKPFEGLDPDRLEKVPIKKGDEPHRYYWGAFEIDVQKRWYAADIGNLQWHQWYSGVFTVDAAGQWQAARPDVTYADALPPGLEP